jgi:DNA polymerase-1
VARQEILWLIDVHSLMNRAFYALAGRHRLTAPDGLPTGALYAFMNMLLKYRDELNPTHVIATLDSPGKVFRHETYPEYKAGRRPMPDDLAAQMPVAQELLDALGFQPTALLGYEADDLIGTLARCGERKGMRVYILTGDRDTFQLVSEQSSVIFLTTSKGKTNSEVITPQKMLDGYGVGPEQWVDVKALMGDSSDNIPGVKGVGKKTALRLIQSYGTLEDVYRHIEEQGGALRRNLEEGREMARLSRDLATIRLDVPCPDIERILERGIRDAADEQALSALLTRLDFRSFLDRLQLSPVFAETCEDQLSIQEAFEALEECATLDVFFELQEDNAPISLFLPKESSEGVVVSLNACCTTCDVNALISRVFSGKYTPVTWDFKAQLRSLDLPAPEIIVFDVMIAGYLLNQLGRGDDIEFTLKAALGDRYQPVGGEELPLLVDQTRILCQTAYMLLFARHQQMEELETRGLTSLADVEMALVNILAEMERKGVLVNQEELDKQSEAMAAEIAALEAAIYDEAGHEFNINSSQQLAEVLYEELGLPHGRKSASGNYSTAQDQLDAILTLHPIVPLVLEYRERSKLRSTFLEGLRKEIGDDGRIHTSYNQTVTATGRLSSSNPNLQNIPIRTERGRAIREIFTVPEGYMLVGADYSQIELRLLAHLSGDEALTEAFREGKDVHRVTAASLFGKSEEEISAEERAVAKTVNFSITYGISDYGLSRDLGIPIRRARSFIERYHKKYPKVESWLHEQGESAKRDGFVETLFRRRRYLPELQSGNRNIYNFGLRAAMNAPVQGTAADIMKMAMVDAWRAFKDVGIKASIILQVHDELIIECLEEDVEHVKILLRDAMENVMDLNVPLVVNVSTGRTWGEL